MLCESMYLVSYIYLGIGIWTNLDFKPLRAQFWPIRKTPMAGSGDPPCFSITGLWNAHFFTEEKRKLISIYLSQIRQSWRLVFWMMEVGLCACVWFSHHIYWKKWWKRIHRKGNQKCKNNQFCYSLHCGLWTTVVGHIFKPLNNDWNESNTVLSYW